MASSTKALFGDRAVKDSLGVGASGGLATSHRPEATAAAHGRLLSELKEKLRVATPKTPSPETTTGLNAPRIYGEGYPTWTQPRAPGKSAKHLSTPTTPVTPCDCRQPKDLQVRVTLRCQCFLHCATVEATRKEEQTKYTNSSYGPRKRGLVCRLVDRFNEKASLQENDARAAVDVSKSATSSTLCKTPPAACAKSPEVSEGEEKECSLDRSGHTSCQGGQSSLDLSVSESSRQRVRDALAQASDTLNEMRRDFSRIFSNGRSFETEQSPTPPMLHSSDDLIALLSLISQLNQDAVDAEADEELLEEDYEDSLDPRIRSRRYIVIDEIDAINDQIESRWAEVYGQLQSSLNERLRQTLDDCRRCPKDEAGVSSQEILLNKATEEWRQLVTDIKADFHTSCADFDKWRTEFLENVFRTSCAALHRRQRLWVLGEILRDDVFASLLVFQRRTRTRVAALWKKLVERRELYLDAQLPPQ
ncbi:hypothetical protein MTO96_009795 [Rhipicephalus appendiculatus]